MASTKRASSSESSADATRSVLDSLRRLVRAFRVLGAAGGPSPAQRFVLEQLAARPGASIGDLARLTHTDQSSVSVVVSRLVDGGLVERRRSEDDARRAELSLSARGKSLAKKSPPSGQARLLDALEALSSPRRSALARELDALVSAMGIEDEPAGMFFEDPPAASRATRSARTSSTTRSARPKAAARPAAKRRIRA
jgi:DNA-binding MarR family transcriptional regulator